MSPRILDTALAALDGGLAPWPPREDGSKAPETEPIPPDCPVAACVKLREAGRDGWVHRQHVRADATLLGRLYANGRTGMGLVCGEISGGLELFEFEGRAAEAGMVEDFAAAADANGLGALVARITAGYAEVTPTDGAHLLYRCTTTRTERLARSPEGVLIETKGEGGFVIVAPSGGRVHPSGGAWELRSGGLDTIATITPEERAELHRLARTFDQMPKPAPRQAPRTEPYEGDSIVDAFNDRATWPEILTPHGWRYRFTAQDGNQHWTRPGKQAGTSATISQDGDGLLFIFSSSTTLEPGRAYSRFGAYSALNHAGDHSAAGRAIRAWWGHKP